MGDPKKESRTVNCCGKEYRRKKVVKWSVFVAVGVPLVVFAVLIVTMLIREE